MKLSLLAFAAAALLTLTPAALHAQTRNIAYGRTNITFTPAFTQLLAAQGVTISDLTTFAPLQNGSDTFTGLEGVLDLQTSFGEVVFAGGYQVTVGGQTLRIQDLTFEIVNATTAYISGVFIVNDKFTGRQPIFAVNMAPTYTLPLQLQNGTITFAPMSLGLTPNFISLINSTTGQSSLNAGTQVGSVTAYAVFAPTTPTGIN